MTQVFDVIVIGCGAAGIAALAKLRDENLQVLGLEAGHKIGGRVCTVHYDDGIVELGAQWCHGEKDNVVFSLVKDLDLVAPISDEQKCVFVKSNGGNLNVEETDKYLDMCVKIVRQEDHVKSQKKTLPLNQFLRDELNKEINAKSFLGNKETANEVLEWYLKSNQSSITANELLQKSVNSLNESWDDKGEKVLHWKDKGYKTIFDVLLQKRPINIELNKEVINIKWKHSSKTVGHNKSLVQVQCRDGSLFEAKHAIVTVSLGVLKERYATLFTPSIPDSKILSVRSLAVCTMNKIFMKFDEAWWHDNCTGAVRFCLVWRDEDRAEFADEDDWLAGVYEISSVAGHPGVLCAVVVGTAAENMELCSSAAVLDGLHRLMAHFLRGRGEVPRPSDILRSTWYTNSLTRGSFSYRSVETECVDKGANVLGEPLLSDDGDVPVVCFAGEATSPHHHYTVHGAIESGFREADRLISVLKSK